MRRYFFLLLNWFSNLKNTRKHFRFVFTAKGFVVLFIFKEPLSTILSTRAEKVFDLISIENL